MLLKGQGDEPGQEDEWKGIEEEREKMWRIE